MFGGSGAVLLNKHRSKVEVYNDLDNDLVNMFIHLRDHHKEMEEWAKYTPYSRALYVQYISEWRKGYKGKDDLERACRFYYIMSASFSGVICGGFSTSSVKSNAVQWKSRVSTLDALAERLRDVVIENLDFRTLIERYDSPDTLFYLDPPYYGVNLYNIKFSEEDHVDLANILNNIQGKAIVSYYPHERLDELYEGWYIDDCKTYRSVDKVKNSNKRKEVTERLYMNFDYKEISNPTGLMKWISKEA